MPIVILKVRSEELMQTISIKRPARLLGAFLDLRNLQIFEYPRIAQRNRTKSADCADPATEHNTSRNAKHSFVLSRGDMVSVRVQ